MENKIIIWGYKYSQDTFSHIHSSYYKAFKYLGYDTYWFDDRDDVSSFNFDNCIFFTEDQVQHKIPLNKTAKYILHHTKLDKYIDNGLKFINLANYLKWCDDGVSAYHKENSVIKINDCCFWDEKTKTIYQPWGTDLTPDEISLDNALKYNKFEPNIYYVGTSHDNTHLINAFAVEASKNGKQMIVTKTSSDKENYNLIRQSYLSVDFRGDWHVECGYVPCRVFKNTSYGRITGTNSENVKKVFGDHIIYDPNPALLFHKLIEAEENKTIDEVKAAIDFIKTNHTFVNRINNLMTILKDF